MIKVGNVKKRKSSIMENDASEMKGNDMSNIKPIQATPELSGQDAINVMKEAIKVPSKNAIDRSNKLMKLWGATKR